MKSQIKAVNRKDLKEERVAICSHFGCNFIKKVKPLKFGIIGIKKYPKCSKHKTPLVYIDEFVVNFIEAVNACLYDVSSLPPRNLTTLISKETPNELVLFINGWMYCSSIGRGARIASRYFNGLSKGYMKLLSRKQKKALQKESNSKNRYSSLRSCLRTIAKQYAAFLEEFHGRSQLYYDLDKVKSLSGDLRKIIQSWLKHQLEDIQLITKNQPENLIELREKYDKILNIGTCSLLLGKTKNILTEKISAFELFSAYYEFSLENLCRNI